MINDPPGGKRGDARWSLAEVGYYARRLARRPMCRLEDLAERSWEIAPREESFSPPAFFLPEMLDRILGWTFTDDNRDPRPAVLGCPAVHAATRGFLVKDVWLLDGALYKGRGYSWLTPRASRVPRLRVDRVIDRGALFCTANGNKYFGQWLMDDCATYSLAKGEGVPVMTDQPVNPHTPLYEEWLEMEPLRLHAAYFRELVIFEDYGQNKHKHRRFRALGEKLLSHVQANGHPGVFILRGSSGIRRVLRGEEEIAERLSRRRGFRVVDPMKSDAPSLIAACAGARTVVGIEGSGLIHGVLPLREGGNILTLQPPTRFVLAYKHLADRDGQNFGFVVGRPDGGDDFYIDPDEVERTLDLFPE
jgi:hypothetical protein